MKFKELPLGAQFKSQGYVYVKVAMSAACEIKYVIATIFQDDTPVELVGPIEEHRETPN
jgi:hypothetical protein